MPGAKGRSGGRRPGAGRPPSNFRIRLGDQVEIHITIQDPQAFEAAFFSGDQGWAVTGQADEIDTGQIWIRAPGLQITITQKEEPEEGIDAEED
jgi:hypothetical protein